MKKLSILILSSILLCACGDAIEVDFSTETPATENNVFANGNWIDLSHTYDKNTIYWPTESGFDLDTSYEGETDKGYYYSAYYFKTAEHGGTHMDAPVHFAKGAHAVDEVPLNRLTGQAVVIDVSEKSIANPDHQISIEDVNQWEKENGALADDVIILFRTGFSAYWPDRKKYMGTDERGSQAVAKLHFPGIDPNLAQWLVDNRKVKAVGLDTPSIDYGQSTEFLTHRILFEKNMPAFENLNHLDKLPTTGAYVVALPMKIGGGSGAPVRVAAFVQE